MVITDIGQVGINTPSGRFILTPSLAAIASLEDPAEMYSDLTHPETPHQWRIETAHRVILACSPDKSIAQFLGRRKIGKPRVRRGVKTTRYATAYVDDIHAIAIADNLMFHGMIGKVETTVKPKESDFTSTFKPIEWMAAAVAHLGVTEQSAWQMTMTSILNALKTKFPPSEKEKARDSYDDDKAAHDEWYASIYGVKP